MKLLKNYFFAALIAVAAMGDASADTITLDLFSPANSFTAGGFTSTDRFVNPFGSSSQPLYDITSLSLHYQYHTPSSDPGYLLDRTEFGAWRFDDTTGYAYREARRYYRTSAAISISVGGQISTGATQDEFTNPLVYAGQYDAGVTAFGEFGRPYHGINIYRDTYYGTTGAFDIELFLTESEISRYMSDGFLDVSASGSGPGSLILDHRYLTFTYNYTDPETSNVPEPATMAMLGAGLACLAASRRAGRRRLLCDVANSSEFRYKS